MSLRHFSVLFCIDYCLQHRAYRILENHTMAFSQSSAATAIMAGCPVVPVIDCTVRKFSRCTCSDTALSAVIRRLRVDLIEGTLSNPTSVHPLSRVAYEKCTRIKIDLNLCKSFLIFA